MSGTPRHKVFVSFHHEDQSYKRRFLLLTQGHLVDKSVEGGDIDDRAGTETIRRNIRDDFIRDATVTVVLVGPCTWRRKHVDWEIGSSLRKTRLNPRCGLLGILLPNHPDHGSSEYDPRLLPPRLADNLEGSDPYALLHDWSPAPPAIRGWIHRAFERRNGTPPDNSRRQYRKNRSGPCGKGWS